jgi:hypothetical protein
MNLFANKKTLLAFLLALAIISAVGATPGRRDPLTDAETEQLREVATEAPERLKLYVKFARARMVAIEQMRADPKFAAERGKRIHDLLEDLGNIVDEMDNNVSTYDRQKADLRKPLKEIIEADSEFQGKLRALKEAPATDPTAVKEQRDYSFVLDDTTESVNSSAETAREVLDAQNEAFAKAKEAEKDKKKK